MGGRIQDHPILGALEPSELCTITVDAQPLEARVGEPILAVLLANGMIATRTTEKYSSPRGLYCGIGLCTDCLVTVDGVPNIRSCVTAVRPDMMVSTQTGRGIWNYDSG